MDRVAFWSGVIGSVIGTVPVGILVTYYGSKQGTHRAEQEERGEV